jgi:hypothetical protein
MYKRALETHVKRALETRVQACAGNTCASVRWKHVCKAFGAITG